MKKFIIILSLSIAISTFGQTTTTKKYSGKYDNGYATYTYYENEKFERIYHGKFNYTENLKEYDALKLSISGNFVDDLRNGEWIFTVKNTKVPVKSLPDAGSQFIIYLAMQMGKTQKEIDKLKKEINNDIAYNTYYSVLKGSYKNGEKNGIWTYKTSFTGSKTYTLPVYSVVKYNDGNKVDTFFYYNNKNNYVSGQFNDSGYTHGIWKIKWTGSDNQLYECIAEYKNGIILTMKERCLNTGEITRSYDYKVLKEYYKNLYIERCKENGKEIDGNEIKEINEADESTYIRNSDYPKEERYKGMSLIYDVMVFWSVREFKEKSDINLTNFSNKIKK